MNKLILILVMSMVLSACGGGGGSGTETTVVTVNNSTTTPIDDSSNDDDSDDSDDTVVGEGMAELEISPEFTLTSKLELPVTVNLNMSDVRAYINICHQKVDEVRANYNKCLVRTALSAGELNTVLTLSEHSIALVAEIWFYDTSTEPLVYSWQYDESSTDQAFEIN
jgi:hypothetical protein